MRRNRGNVETLYEIVKFNLTKLRFDEQTNVLQKLDDPPTFTAKQSAFSLCIESVGVCG